jgi:ribosomal RNA-processing protein 1
MTDNEKLFAIGLADNEKKIREKQIRKIRTYIQARAISTTQSQFTEDDMIKMWKGLHYCMWMCDKPLVQVKNKRKSIIIF